jgi:hypothetical protein
MNSSLHIFLAPSPKYSCFLGKDLPLLRAQGRMNYVRTKIRYPRGTHEFFFTHPCAFFACTGQDIFNIFKMLLKHLLVIDCASEIAETERLKAERLLAEYFETKGLLNISLE